MRHLYPEEKTFVYATLPRLLSYFARLGGTSKLTFQRVNSSRRGELAVRVCFASRDFRVRISHEFPTDIVHPYEVSPIRNDSLRYREFFAATNKSARIIQVSINVYIVARRVLLFRVYACVSVSLACTRPEDSAQNWPKQKEDGTRACVRACVRSAAESVYVDVAGICARARAFLLPTIGSQRDREG